MKKTLLFVLGISMFSVSGGGFLFVEGSPRSPEPGHIDRILREADA
tara:strand:+ start:223 stop:360 length:138 start_codon:yes stop_codon:yes gene_type:complete